MTIIDSFDNLSPAKISPCDVLTKHKKKLDVCIITFSNAIINNLLEGDFIELLCEDKIRSVSQDYPVYLYKKTNIGIIKTSVGAAMTAGLIEEVGYAFSCSNFVLFGSCGGLDKTISPAKVIVATEAYRDEGLSYHYVQASDYIKIKNSNLVGKFLDEIGVEYVTGKVWTTDSFYRETENNYLKRRNDGCIAVDMELSACQAVCDFRGYELFNFLYRGDNLDTTGWEKSILSNLSKDQRLMMFFIALEIAKKCKK